jgi:hypothetical protein
VNEDGYVVGTPASGLPDWRDAPPIRPAVKDQP